MSAAAVRTTTAHAAPPQARRRAHALFYDDTLANFHGAGPGGKHPHVICQRLTAPVTPTSADPGP